MQEFSFLKQDDEVEYRTERKPHDPRPYVVGESRICEGSDPNFHVSWVTDPSVDTFGQ